VYACIGSYDRFGYCYHYTVCCCGTSYVLTILFRYLEASMKRVILVVLVLVACGYGQQTLIVPPGGIQMPNVQALSTDAGIFSCASGSIDACQWVDYAGNTHSFSGGGGNLNNSGTPLIHQTGVFVDATHMKGIANGTTGQCWLAATGADPGWGSCGGAIAFSAITTGTNANALHMGTGGSLDATGTGTIAATSLTVLSGLPAQAADTVDMNATSGSASPTAVVMPTCTTGADLYNTSTHSWSCVTTSRVFGTTFGDTAGSALASGSTVYFMQPYACTIQAWDITVDAGTVTFDIWKIATGTAIPTVTNKITASALPALSTGTALHSTTMTAWTTSVAAGDIFGFNLKTVATAK